MARRHNNLKSTPHAALACGALVLTVGALLALAENTPSGKDPETHPETPLPPQDLPQLTRAPISQPAVGLQDDAHLDTAPPRHTTGLDLSKNGWTYNCMDCHQLFKAKWHYYRPLVEHKHIALTHGANRFCLNCHHPSNRNAFVDYDGSEIPERNVVQLCAKCHGPTFRDWNAGVHGRQNGHWNTDFGNKTKLSCVQCHDPHSPQLKPMHPMAPLRYPPRAAHQPREHPATPASHD